jgi:hypothetical protein
MKGSENSYLLDKREYLTSGNSHDDAGSLMLKNRELITRLNQGNVSFDWLSDLHPLVQ